MRRMSRAVAVVALTVLVGGGLWSLTSLPDVSADEKAKEASPFEDVQLGPEEVEESFAVESEELELVDEAPVFEQTESEVLEEILQEVEEKPAKLQAASKEKTPAPRFLLLLTERFPEKQSANEPIESNEFGDLGSSVIRTASHNGSRSRQDKVRIFCGDAKINTAVTGDAIDYKIECAGKIRVENDGTIIECSRLVYEKGFLTLDDVTVRDKEPKGGLFSLLQAGQMTIKYAVANVTLQREPKKQKKRGSRRQFDPDWR